VSPPISVAEPVHQTIFLKLNLPFADDVSRRVNPTLPIRAETDNFVVARE
jgi:hypothetical protein